MGVAKTTKTTVTKATKATLKAEKKKAGKKAQSATGKKNAAAMKKKGVGIFAPKTLSPALAAICGGKVMPRTEVTKKLWVFIKKHKLSASRTITPNAELAKVFPKKSFSMFEMAKMVSAHLK